MENLAIDSGAVELTIDDDKDRVIRFYPTDVSFAEAYYALADRFGKLRGEVAANPAEPISISVRRPHLSTV